MKRFTFILLLMLVTFGFAGCDGGGEDDDTAEGKITVNITYSGALGTDVNATKKIYVFLYNKRPYDAGVDADYEGSTTEAITQDAIDSSEEQTITISNVKPGDYYILVVYDWKKHTQRVAGKDDRYIFYSIDYALKSGANPLKADFITVTDGSHDNLTITTPFNDTTFLLLDKAAFQP